MIKLIDTKYNECCGKTECWLVDTDDELSDLPAAPAGSYAISVESRKTYYVNNSGEWPLPGAYDDSSESGGGGVTSWNDLTDKPFGETITETILIDNQAFSYSADDEAYIISIDENLIKENRTYKLIVNGIELEDVGKEFSASDDLPLWYYIGDKDGNDMCFMSQNWGEAGKFDVFNFSTNENITDDITLTLIEYATETVPLPNKYLDIIETVGGDTLTWDGDTSGLDTFGVFFRVSESTPTYEDFANGFITTNGEGVSTSFEQSSVADIGNGVLVCEGTFVVVPSDNVDTGDIIIEKKGVYFYYGEIGYVSSLTINGYTGFTKEQVKEEYLPNDVTTFYVSSDYIANETDGLYWLFTDNGYTTKAKSEDITKALSGICHINFEGAITLLPVQISVIDNVGTVICVAYEGELATIIAVTSEYTG